MIKWVKGHLSVRSAFIFSVFLLNNLTKSWTPSLGQRYLKLNFCMSDASLRKHPFLFALHRWGRFTRRNVYDSATEIPYWWRKICLESGRKRWLDVRDVILFYSHCLGMTAKRPKATKVKYKRDESNSQYLWNIFFSRRSIWVLLDLVRK